MDREELLLILLLEEMVDQEEVELFVLVPHLVFPLQEDLEEQEIHLL